MEEDRTVESVARDVMPAVIPAPSLDDVSRLPLRHVHALQSRALGKYDAVDLFDAFFNFEHLERTIVAVDASGENCTG